VKTYGEVEEQLFTLAMDKVSGELHAPAPLLLTGKDFGGEGKNRIRVRWFQSRSWCFGKEKKLLLCRQPKSDCQVVRSSYKLLILTSYYRLSMKGVKGCEDAVSSNNVYPASLINA